MACEVLLTEFIINKLYDDVYTIFFAASFVLGAITSSSC